MRSKKNSRPSKHSRKRLQSRNPLSIYTAGELFSNGATIDLVRSESGAGIELHYFDGEKTFVGDAVEAGGKIFLPSKSDRRAELVRLPSHSSPFGTIADLFAEARELFVRFGFSPEVAFAAVIFCCATWFADILPTAPCLIIFGPTLEAALLLDLISCLARRSLPIGEFSRGAISVLPLELQPTLVITAESLSKASIALFRTSNRRRAYLQVKSDLADVFCAKAIHCANVGRIDPDALQIELLPFISRLETLDHETREKIAVRFQPRFLDYRSRNILRVRHSDFDVPDLGSSTRLLARALGSTIEGARDLQAELASLFQGHEEQQYESHLTDLRYVVVEALLDHAHRDHGARVSVGTITGTVNAIFLGRGDATKRKAREIGAELKSLGVRKKRRRDGYAFELDDAFSGHVHKVAHSMGVFAAREPNPDCAHCQEISETKTLPCDMEVEKPTE